MTLYLQHKNENGFRRIPFIGQNMSDKKSLKIPQKSHAEFIDLIKSQLFRLLSIEQNVMSWT